MLVSATLPRYPSHSPTECERVEPQVPPNMEDRCRLTQPTARKLPGVGVITVDVAMKQNQGDTLPRVANCVIFRNRGRTESPYNGKVGMNLRLT